MSDLWKKIYTERLFECTFIYTSQRQTEMLEDKVHGGDSPDFKTTTMTDNIQFKKNCRRDKKKDLKMTS